MLQWREIKSRHPDALVFFRVGDFYEMFYEDAVAGARLLDLTLTSRNNGSSRAPLAGVPAVALDGYLERLVGLGRRVAICDQIEEAALAKGLVRREVTELVTPGAVFSERLLDARRNNFLAAVAGDREGGKLGLAAADLTTGEVILYPASPAGIADLLALVEPSELLLPRGWEGSFLSGAADLPRTFRPDWMFDPATAEEELLRGYGVLDLSGFGLGGGDEPLLAACGALVAYLGEIQPMHRSRLRPPRVERGGETLFLDQMTCRNLELVEPLRGTGSKATLLGVLDRAETPMGARLLRRWLLSPLLDVEKIRARHDAVEELAQADLRRALRGALAGVRDLERLAVKISARRASPRDLLATGGSLERLPVLADLLSNAGCGLLVRHRDGIDPLGDVREVIEGAIDPDAPPSLADGGVIRAGYDHDLDELRSLRDGARGWIAQLQQRERERTGIGSLKVGFNRVFGYYLEVTRANLERVPDDYQRRQTLSGAERFVTPELKEWEAKVVGAEEEIAATEARLFAQVREKVAAEAGRLQETAAQVAVLDVLACFAEVAVRNGYARPEIQHGFDLEIEAGRHPVVETVMPRESFIPNGISLDQDHRVVILTGPNMAGKSTVLRQVGLIVLLAQTGSFVPARAARVGVVDRLFTRVGASDNLALGQSTFMVEMSETAAILNGATERSLVLLDEVGRGTSTWDGLSVAVAATEDLHQRIGAKTIFATHFHELTRLAERLPGVVNLSVAVREEGDEVIFLHRLVAGGADRSYGVEVARLAGLPAGVVARAREVLSELERGEGAAALTRPPADPDQLPLFDTPLDHPVLTRLRGVDPELMTPLEALNLLAELAGSVEYRR